MEPPQREHIHDDLRGILKGEVLWDDISQALYSTDASIFQVRPLGVVVPRDEEDVRALVRYAAEHQVPLVPRGAGSGLAGEALGPGVIVDLSRHFRAIGAVEGDSVRVQPGVVLRDLNVRLAREGRRFAPDPASAAQCTVGGMLATNASGANALRYGYTRDHVDSLRVVLDNGDAEEVGTVPDPWAFKDRADRPAGDRLRAIVPAVAELLVRQAEVIRTSMPRTPFNRCGYLLHDVLSRDHLELARLLVGSEGTLAVFTEATLRTVPLPAERSLVLLSFASLDRALEAAQKALGWKPAACELIDRRLLTLARGTTEFGNLVPSAAEAVLLIALESDTPGDAREAAVEMTDRLYRSGRLALLAQTAFAAEEIDQLWRLREAVLPSLYGLRGEAQPVAFVEDVGIPTDQLRPYLLRVQDILQRHDTTASFLVHAGTGQVHTRPFLDLQNPADLSKLFAIADEVHNLVLDLGGTVSTQHGTGLARTPWVARQYGRLYPVFRELKAIFDPNRLFNPGKIVGPDPGVQPWPLRKASSGSRPALDPAKNGSGPPPANGPEPLPTALRWKPGEPLHEALHCNGCGQCRTQSPAQRMCPIFRATHAEAATPRAKANLMRHLLHGDTDPRLLSSDEVREVADLCVNCKMCAIECPAHVNIPKLMLEAKAANVAAHGLTRADWVMARTESIAALGSGFAFVVNAALGSRSVRWFLERFFGVSRQRHLPAFAQRSFLRLAERRGWTRKPGGKGPGSDGQTSRPEPMKPNSDKVAYFVDVFANYNDPQIAEAVVAVLQHNGIRVYVPPRQRGCGMAALAYGDVETACEIAQHNLRILADLAREGYIIVCAEPTAALMLRHDYPDLLGDPDARLVADHTVELTAFLAGLHRQGRLRTDFRPLPFAVGHHVPCHLKALGPPPAGPGLLALIPGLRVHTIDVSCSGMAGTFGLQEEHYAVSLEAGRPMLEELRRPRVLFGSTECSTCRLQMEGGSGKRALHPAQYLALAYGLMPELARRLLAPIRDLVL